MTPEFGNLAEIVGAITEIQVRIDSNWTFFLSINAAVLGGIVMVERTFDRIQKSIIIIIYSCLTTLNFLTTYNTYQHLYAIIKDVEKLEYTPNQAGYDVISYYSGLDIINIPWLIPGIYVTAFFVIVLCIIFEHKFTPSKI